MCSNPFCTCCRDAYLEGLRDGYQFGYQRGYKTGYVHGYVDATLRIAPPVEQYPDIQTRLKIYALPPASTLTPTGLTPRKKRCHCVGVCICGA